MFCVCGLVAWLCLVAGAGACPGSYPQGWPSRPAGCSVNFAERGLSGTSPPLSRHGLMDLRWPFCDPSASFRPARRAGPSIPTGLPCPLPEARRHGCSGGMDVWAVRWPGQRAATGPFPALKRIETCISGPFIRNMPPRSTVLFVLPFVFPRFFFSPRECRGYGIRGTPQQRAEGATVSPSSIPSPARWYCRQKRGRIKRASAPEEAKPRAGTLASQAWEGWAREKQVRLIRGSHGLESSRWGHRRWSSPGCPCLFFTRRASIWVL